MILDVNYEKYLYANIEECLDDVRKELNDREEEIKDDTFVMIDVICEIDINEYSNFDFTIYYDESEAENNIENIKDRIIDKLEKELKSRVEKWKKAKKRKE